MVVDKKSTARRYRPACGAATEMMVDVLTSTMPRLERLTSPIGLLAGQKREDHVNWPVFFRAGQRLLFMVSVVQRLLPSAHSRECFTRKRLARVFDRHVVVSFS